MKTKIRIKKTNSAQGNQAVLINLSISHLSIIWMGVALSYVVFGIAGFGTALVASPLLAQFMPVSHIVPLLALLDFFAATTNLMRDGRKAELSELKRLVPLMMMGSGIGALILLFTKPDVLLLLLGVFVIGYSVYSLSGFKPVGKFGPVLSVPFGLVGGIFSALFGSGGFIYAIYLQSRLDSKERIRVTQTTLIGLSTLTRLVIFLVAGVYADVNLLLLALLLAPSMLAGVWLGRHITLKLSREQFVKLVNVVILVSGLFLIVRYFS
ncbi:sulfite exporter TauE/SafE family protein [Burkholderia cepacia]|uniref:sulfite exporter TauE/SafE family protein n=1 Tax=Burkholderia cepacia TaxID=292 RepID=UPI0012A82EBB|nr:sulfite exporter TauE/SafE family protein [Burkholderia cepacia]MCE4128300.1 sulfite exporter TauE/SafE family protein [Burkholderia cepacia]QFS36859.1 Sulfite exporter TauE/SafE [Burkholderia cepacia]